MPKIILNGNVIPNDIPIYKAGFTSGIAWRNLLEICDMPVEVVTGKSLPLLERWGIPALGAGAATALMAVVID